jgi:hypothetical protein
MVLSMSIRYHHHVLLLLLLLMMIFWSAAPLLWSASSPRFTHIVLVSQI